jgi:hypothetical protein
LNFKKVITWWVFLSSQLSKHDYSVHFKIERKKIKKNVLKVFATFVNPLLVQSFRIKDDESSIDILNVTCIFNQTTHLSSWKWIYKSNLHSGLPICGYFCEMPPPSEKKPILNRQWDGLHWQGSELSYNCQAGMIL